MVGELVTGVVEGGGPGEVEAGLRCGAASLIETCVDARLRYSRLGGGEGVKGN